MVIFHSYVSLPEGNSPGIGPTHDRTNGLGKKKLPFITFWHVQSAGPIPTNSACPCCITIIFPTSSNAPPTPLFCPETPTCPCRSCRAPRGPRGCSRRTRSNRRGPPTATSPRRAPWWWRQCHWARRRTSGCCWGPSSLKWALESHDIYI